MDKQKLKQIFEREIKRHTNEIAEHKKNYELRGSKQQKEKMIKHFHKRFQTVLLAKQLGFEFCGCCGTLLTQQIKKDRDDSSNDSYLEPRSSAWEGNKSERMQVGVSPFNEADTQSAGKYCFVEDDIIARMQYKDGIYKPTEDEDE